MESSSSPSKGHLRIRTLSKTSSASSSFRLRSPSLNCLRLRRIFDLFDKNGDGFITADELGRALGLLGLEADLAELESTLEAFVEPGSLGLRFDDFLRLHQSIGDALFGGGPGPDGDDSAVSAQEEEDLSEAFKVFDEDGDGFISACELQAVLGKLGMAEGDEIGRVERMITSVDRNCDGRVDFFEFKDMMRSVIVRSS